MACGKLFGVGIGPGDPELVTVKAARVIAEADVVAFHSARHGRSISRMTAAPYLRAGVIEEHLIYPVTTEATDHPGGYHGAIDAFYADAADRLAAHLEAGRNVALLAAGDPLFYSSYMHMHKRLAQRYDVEVIPGVTAVSAATAAIGTPLVEAEQVLTVLPGTMPADELTARLRSTDAAAIMKLGRTYPSVVHALEQAGRLDEAWYVERASTSSERVMRPQSVEAQDVPYFSIVIVPAPEPTHAAPSAAGEVVVIGLGPGDDSLLTPLACRELAAATDIVGYTTYVNRITLRPGQIRHASDNRVEGERAAMALDLARRGRRVAVVSSGDPGVFAMAAAVYEQALDYPDVLVRVVPGVTAANAVAAKAGAPLGHDYAVISLSDRLKPWETVEQRITAVAAADMAIAIYNPGSSERTWQVARLKELLLELRDPSTVVVVGRDVYGPTESVRVTTLSELDPATIDMRTLLIIGASTTSVVEGVNGPRAYTSRRYGVDVS